MKVTAGLLKRIYKQYALRKLYQKLLYRGCRYAHLGDILGFSFVVYCAWATSIAIEQKSKSMRVI